MEPFNNYLKICFNNQNYTIEIPDNLEEIHTTSFYTKNDNEESKIELNQERVKEILDVVIKLENNSLIYCSKKINKSNLVSLFAVLCKIKNIKNVLYYHASLNNLLSLILVLEKERKMIYIIQ